MYLQVRASENTKGFVGLAELLSPSTLPRFPESQEMLTIRLLSFSIVVASTDCSIGVLL